MEFLVILSSYFVISRVYEDFSLSFKKLSESFSYIYMFFIICSISYIKHPYLICWFFVTPLMLNFCFSFKKSMFLIVLTFTLMVLLDFFIKTTNFPMPEEISENSLFFKIFAVNTVVFSFIIIAMMSYYFSEIIKYNQVVLNLQKINEIKKSYKEENNRKQLEFLFKKIEKHLKTNKPWLDPNYNLKQLAKDLNSNTLYVSKCIYFMENKKFKDYINGYRESYFYEKKKKKKLNKEIYFDQDFSKEDIASIFFN